MSVLKAVQKWNERIKAAKQNNKEANKALPKSERVKFEDTQLFKRLNKSKYSAVYYQKNKTKINAKRKQQYNQVSKAVKEVKKKELDFTDETLLDAFSSKEGKIFDTIIKGLEVATFTGIIQHNKSKQFFTNYIAYKTALDKILAKIYKLDSDELMAYKVARAYDYNKTTKHLTLFTKVYKNHDQEDE